MNGTGAVHTLFARALAACGAVVVFGLVLRPSSLPSPWRGALGGVGIAAVALGAFRAGKRAVQPGPAPAVVRSADHLPAPELFSSSEAKAWLQRVLAQEPADQGERASGPPDASLPVPDGAPYHDDHARTHPT